MKEKREAEIRGKIIKPEDIRRFAKLIDEICREFIKDISAKGLHYNLSFNIETVDGITYSSDSTSIFDPGGLLDSKIIKQVNMSFSSYRPSASAEIRILDSRHSGWGNSVEVSGSDSTWVSGIFGRLIDSLNSCIRQGLLGTKFKWPISILSSILIGLALVGVINIILNYVSNSSNYLSYWFSIVLIGLAGIITMGVEKLWPEVEIISGAEKAQASSKLKAFLYLIVLPIIVALVASFISSSLSN